MVPATAAALHLQQVEAAEEEDEEHVGDDDKGDGGGVIREFAIPQPVRLLVNDRKFPAGNSVFLSHQTSQQ